MDSGKKVSVLIAQLMFQRGHSFSEMDSSRGAPLHAISKSFSGATSFQKWIVINRIGNSRSRISFSGATSFQKWIVEARWVKNGYTEAANVQVSTGPLLFRNG